MRRVSTFTQRRSAVDIQMTPMIDVVFLLLVFFVWTTSFQIAEYILPSSVSEAAPAGGAATDAVPPPEADFEQVVVRIRWDGAAPAWTINDLPLPDLTAVRLRLQAIAAVNLAAPVIVDPDADTPLGRVIDLYDLARQVGFSQVQFAVAE